MFGAKNKSLKTYARALRKNMTEQERKLWNCFLKKLPYVGHRQRQFGEYIVDFYCAKARLVIEIDGAHHYTVEGRKQDKARDEYLKSLGLDVLRFSDAYVDEKFREVCETIKQRIGVC